MCERLRSFRQHTKPTTERVGPRRARVTGDALTPMQQRYLSDSLQPQTPLGPGTTWIQIFRREAGPVRDHVTSDESAISFSPSNTVMLGRGASDLDTRLYPSLKWARPYDQHHDFERDRARLHQCSGLPVRRFRRVSYYSPIKKTSVPENASR